MRSINALAVLVVLIAGFCVQAQVWVDESQLKAGKLPEWVDPQYCKPAPVVTPTPTRCRVWVEPVYRDCSRRVWHEAVYQCVSERIWVAGHFESRPVKDLSCPTPREERVWVDGHYEVRERRVLVTPGYWENIVVREIVTPGHWETRDS